MYGLPVTHQWLIPRAGLGGSSTLGKGPAFWSEMRRNKEPGPSFCKVPKNVPPPPFSPFRPSSPQTYFTFLSQEHFFIFPFFPLVCFIILANRQRGRK